MTLGELKRYQAQHPEHWPDDLLVFTVDKDEYARGIAWSKEHGDCTKHLRDMHEAGYREAIACSSLHWKFVDSSIATFVDVVCGLCNKEHCVTDYDLL